MSVRRKYHQSVAIMDIILVLGGEGFHTDILFDFGANLDSVEIYDHAKNEGSPAASMLHARIRFIAEASRDFVYVFGGDDAGTLISSIERYSIRDDTWTMVINFYLFYLHKYVSNTY